MDIDFSKILSGLGGVRRPYGKNPPASERDTSGK